MTLNSSKIYDLGIIGGGIAGAGIARDAALRGASVVLLEKNSFGSGTSSKSSKLIHGGLRYLEIAWKELCAGRVEGFWENLRFVFLALRETHRLQVLAPKLIRPIPLIVPIYKNGKRRPLSVYFGTYLYGILARINGNPHLSKILNSKESVLKLLPELNPEGLLGGVIVWDHTTDDQALVKAIINSAVKSGAAAFEHAEVQTYIKKTDGMTYEIAAEINGERQLFRCRKIINASGPWADQVRRSAAPQSDQMLMPIAGAHIEIKKFSNYSAILEAEDGRLFFMINRGERARIGTTERICETPDQVSATEKEIKYLLGSLNKFFPGKNFKDSDILCSDAGIRPLVKPKRDVSANQISREHEFVKDELGAVHVLGVKLTDHRRAAEELLNQLAPELAKFNPKILLETKTRTEKLI